MFTTGPRMSGETPETPGDSRPDDSTGPEPHPEGTLSAETHRAADLPVSPGTDSPGESTLLSDEATLPSRAADPTPAAESTLAETPSRADQDDEAILPPRATGDASGRDVETIVSAAPGEHGTKVATESHGRYFGEYELLQEIARGGMGVVYKARQSQLNRTVALKMILSGQLASQNDVKRFYIEAEAAASLEHPGIVPIYEIGEHEGQHFFSMGFIEGAGLDVQVSEGPMHPRKAAAVTLQVCEAITYAHSKNVIHRDLKPANVLIDGKGQAKVTDFGLAKKTDADSGLTGTGQILGTPSYMPPEQASGKTDNIGPAADIYSLGAILYALLTGRPPFQSANVMDTLVAVLEQDPVPPCQFNPALDAGLEKVCLKCLEKDPFRRYETAEELTLELRRYLNGDPLYVETHTTITRIMRSLGRSRYDTNFGEWGSMLCWFSPVIGCAEILVTYLCWGVDVEKLPQKEVIFLRVIQCLVLGLIVWLKRQAWSLKVGTVERQMIATCLGFIAACASILAIVKIGIANGFYSKGGDLNAYQFLFLISGFLFSSLGANYWGGCYGIAVGFFLLAPLSLLCLPYYAPLAFGLSWAIVLLMVGRRLISMAPAKKDMQSIDSER